MPWNLRAPIGRFSKPIGPVAVNWAHPLNRGLLAAYVLSEGAGGFAQDATGRLRPATIWSGSYSSAVKPWQGSDRGIGFATDYQTGSLEYVDIPNFDYASLLGNQYSVSCIFLPSDLSYSNWVWMYQLNDATDALLWRMYYSTDLGFGVRDDLGNHSQGILSSCISKDKWHHVVGTRDGNNVTVYCNGVQGSTGTTSLTGSITVNRCRLGGQGGNEPKCKVLLMEIWQRTLSHSDVMAEYLYPFGNSACPRFYPINDFRWFGMGWGGATALTAQLADDAFAWIEI